MCVVGAVARREDSSRFFYRCESNKKESSKKFQFRRTVLKIENYIFFSYFHSTEVQKEEALSIPHFKTVSLFRAI